MGPLFSTAIAILGFAFAVAAAFLVLRLFRASGHALALALVFAIGGFLGTGLAAIAAISVIGTGQTLHSSGAVVAYLGSLFVAGFVGGGFAVRQVSRVLTRRLNQPPSAAAELQR